MSAHNEFMMYQRQALDQHLRSSAVADLIYDLSNGCLGKKNGIKSKSWVEIA